MYGGPVSSSSNENRPRSSRTSMLVQPFAQHGEIVQQLAMIPPALAVLVGQVANPGGVEPPTVVQALPVCQLVGPGAGRPTREPHLQRDGKAVLGSLEQVGRDESSQQRLEERLPSLPIQEPL